MSSNEKSTRDRILDASWKLLERGAGKSVRMVDIAAQANVSRQAVYLLFENRANLVQETRNFVDAKYGVKDEIDRVLSQNSATQTLKAYVLFWSEYLSHIHGLAHAMQVGALHDKAAARARQDCLDDHFKVCCEIAKRLKNEKALANGWSEQSAAEMIFSVISLDMWLELVVVRRWSTIQLAEHQFALLIGGISTVVAKIGD